MKLSQLFKKKKSDKIKMPIRRIVSNNLFMLRMVHRSVPGLLGCDIIVTLGAALTSFLASTYMLRYALNGIAEGKSFFGIATMVVVCLVARLVMGWSQSFFYNKVYPVKSCKLTNDIRKVVYEKAAQVELGCYENPEYYDTFVKAIDECTSRAQAVMGSVGNIIYVITSFSANFGLLVAIDPMLLIFSLFPLLCIPITAVANKIAYERKMEMTAANRRKEYTRRTFYLSDYAKEMRLSNMPALMLERFVDSGKRVIGIIRKYGFRVATLNYLKTECLNLLTPLSATMYAVWRTLGAGTMGYGDCVVVVNSISTVAYSLTNCSDMFLKFQDNALYIENLRKFLDYTPKITDGDKPLPEGGDIVLNNVSFRYEGAEGYTLRNISMRFGEKEKIAIVGHNGAGKSTLVKLLLRLYDAEGEITYGDVKISDFALSEYRDAFSAVMQDFHLFALPVAENVLLHPRTQEDDEVITESLKKSGLYEKVKDFENGENTVMTKEFDPNGMQMSGGEQQKLAIAHVYSKSNRFVILDEPSSALDPIAEHEMYERMSEACRDCGMIFISHRLSSAVSADRIYLMENGEVAEAGTHRELMELNGRYAEMFRHQAENYAEVTV